MKFIVRSLAIASLATALFVGNLSAQTAKGTNVIKKGSAVSLEYTLSDEKGKIIESNKGEQPLYYVHGRSEIVPGLEKALDGMAVGGVKHVTVKPEDGYGVIDPAAFREVPKENVPKEALKVGTELVASNGQGESMPVRLHEIKDKTVVIDMNHPMAGKTLVFDIKVLDVKSATAK